MARLIRRGVMGAALVAATAAPAAAASPVARSPAAIRSYWTPERMRGAVPAEQIAPRPLGLSPVPSPAGPSAARRRASLHHRVPRTRRYPNRTHGKVFFSEGLTDFVCSGTAVRAPSRSLVWTAGHCVYEPGLGGSGYATNWEFVPGYKNGHKPFGEWPAAKLHATKPWRHSGGLPGEGDPRFDFGAATVSRKQGKTLQGKIGARGIAFDLPRDTRYHAFGYPAEPPPFSFDGEHLFRCDSPYKGSDNNFGSPQPIRIACDMTGGASGGGWVIRRHGHPVVASVTSYGYQGESNRLYGPYQGRVARNFYRGVRGG